MGKVKGVSQQFVTSRRLHDSAPARGRDDVEAEVDQKEILAKKPDGKVKWMAKAMELVVKGKMKVTVLYDILAHPKFATGFGRGVGRQARSLVDTHLHLFSAKQQKFLQSDACKFSSFEAVAIQGDESESDVEQSGNPAKDSVADANETAPRLTSESAPLEPAAGVAKATFKFSFGKKRDEDEMNALEAAAEAKKQKDKEKQEAREKAKTAGDGAEATATSAAKSEALGLLEKATPQQPVNLLKQLGKPNALQALAKPNMRAEVPSSGQPAKDVQKPAGDSRSSTDGDGKHAADVAGKEVAPVAAPAKKKHSSRSRSRRRRSRSRRRSSRSRSRRRRSSPSKKPKRSLQDIINDKVERMTAR